MKDLRCKNCNKKLAYGKIEDEKSYIEILCTARREKTGGEKCGTLNKFYLKHRRT